MAFRGRLPFTTLLFVVALLPSCYYVVCAEDETDGSNVEATEPAEGASAPGEGDVSEESDKFIDSAKELQDKLGQLTQLLENKGDQVDPELKDRLEGLKKQLKSLGLQDFASGEDSKQPTDTKELHNFLAGCASMSMRRAGLKSPTTMGAMRRLATAGLTREQGKDIALVKLIAVCITELSDTELDLYKSGKLTQVSQAMETRSKTPEAQGIVLGLDDEIWNELGHVARSVVSAQGGEDPRNNSLSSNLGLLALVPIICAAVFLTKKFTDVQREAEDKKAKKGKKQK